MNTENVIQYVRSFLKDPNDVMAVNGKIALMKNGISLVLIDCNSDSNHVVVDIERLKKIG